MISTFSGGGNCVDVSLRPDGSVAIAHSQKLPATLMIRARQYDVFIYAVRTDGMISKAKTDLQFDEGVDGSVTLRGDGMQLRFTASEWSAFRQGAQAGEFDRSNLV